MVLKACGSSDEPHECNGICEQATSADMHICFGLFLYNMEIRNTDPVVACEKIKCATDQRFSCYDREEEAIGLNNYISTGYIDDIYRKVCVEDAAEGTYE